MWIQGFLIDCEYNKCTKSRQHFVKGIKGKTNWSHRKNIISFLDMKGNQYWSSKLNLTPPSYESWMKYRKSSSLNKFSHDQSYIVEEIRKPRSLIINLWQENHDDNDEIRVVYKGCKLPLLVIHIRWGVQESCMHWATTHHLLELTSTNISPHCILVVH